MKAIGIILAGGHNERLGPLAKQRAAAALPIGSCYRCLDFSLSNMTNSGIGKVAVLTQYNARSLHDHLSSSKWWDFGRKQGGLFIFSPYLSEDNSYWFRGTADSIHQNITYLKRSNEPYVIIASGDIIYKMDYNAVLQSHVETGADITIVYKEMQDFDSSQYGTLTLDEDGRLLEFEEKPLEPLSDLVSTGIYVISRTLLIEKLEQIIPEGRYDIVKDILIRYRKRLKIMGYRFDGYWHAVNSIETYFNANMDFLKRDVRDLFTNQQPYISTKPKDEPPAKYNANANARNCLVGSGSIINGHINHAVLFRKVFTGDHSSIRNAIVMEGSYIGDNCVVENAIIDKEVVLSGGKQVIGEPDNPIVIAKGTVL